MRMSELSVLGMIWPHPEPPSAEEVRLLLAPHAEPGAPGDEEVDGVRWHQPWRTPEGDDILVSLEPLKAQDLELLLVMSALSEADRARVRRARWVLPIASRLDPKHPLEAFQRQVRLGVAACPDALGIHDVAAHRIVPHERAQEIARWTAPPPVTDLYMVHAVYTPPDAQRWWLHTHGLERAGLPDVEMLRVPDRYMIAAGQLIEGFIRGTLGRELPIRGECPDVFAGARVAWIPATEAAVALRASEPGNPKERGNGHGHVGRRIALVEAGRKGRAWRLPLDLLEEFECGDAIVALPPEESRRTAQLAREQWSVFGMLFTDHHGDPEWDFHVCVGLPTRGGGREYLWWEALEIRPNQVRGRLVNEPLGVDGLRPGHEAWHDLAELSDWAVGAPDRCIRPATLQIPA